MKIKNGLIGACFAVPVLAATLVLVGCGGGTSGGGSSASLKSVLYSALNTAPVVSSTLLQQAGTAIAGASVTYVSDQTGVAGFGAARIAVANAASNAGGIASFAVPSGAYTAQLSTLPADVVAGENAPYHATETVSASGSKTYQSDQYSLVITAPVPLASVQVSVYQTDGSGQVDWGSYTTLVKPFNGGVGNLLRDPLVFDKTAAITGTSTTAVIENVELFKGNYRIVVRGTPVNPANSLAPYIGSAIAVAGGGGTSNPIFNLAAPSIAPSVKLQDTSGAPITTGYRVDFYESVNHILLGSAITDASGVASIGAASGVTSVVAKIYDSANVYRGVYVFSDITVKSSVTLQQFNVSGKIVPPMGTSLNATAIPTVYALANSGLGRWADTEVTSVAASAGTGAYTLTLFGDITSSTATKYKLGARDVTDFPDVTMRDAAVSNPIAGQDISVAPGGVITGKIQTEGNVPLAGVAVAVYGAAADGVIEPVKSGVTDGAGIYNLQVPYGTYFLMVNGAVSDGLSVTAGSSTISRNLTQFSITGQVSINLGNTTQGASGATVIAGTQTATTNNLGVYTLNVMEGKNWICAAPSAVNDPAYGYYCNLNIVVDASSVAAARQ